MGVAGWSPQKAKARAIAPILRCAHYWRPGFFCTAAIWSCGLNRSVSMRKVSSDKEGFDGVSRVSGISRKPGSLRSPYSVPRSGYPAGSRFFQGQFIIRNNEFGLNTSFSVTIPCLNKARIFFRRSLARNRLLSKTIPWLKSRRISRYLAATSNRISSLLFCCFNFSTCSCRLACASKLFTWFPGTAVASGKRTSW